MDMPIKLVLLSFCWFITICNGQSAERNMLLGAICKLKHEITTAVKNITNEIQHGDANGCGFNNLSVLAGHVSETVRTEIFKIKGDISENLSQIKGEFHRDIDVSEAVNKLKDGISRDIKDQILEAVSSLMKEVKSVYNNTQNAHGEILASVSNLKDEIKSEIKDEILGVISNVKEIIKSEISESNNKTEKSLSNLKEEISRNITNHQGELKTEMAEAVNKLKAEISRDIKDYILEMVSSLKEDVLSVYNSTQDTRDEIVASVTNMKEEIKSEINNEILGVANNVTETVKSEISEHNNKTNKSLSNLKEAISRDINNHQNELKSEMSEAVSKLKDEISKSVSKDINNLKDEIQSEMSQSLNKLKEEINSNIKDPILQTVSSLKEQVQSVCNKSQNTHDEILASVSNLKEEIQIQDNRSINVLKDEMEMMGVEISKALKSNVDNLRSETLKNNEILKAVHYKLPTLSAQRYTIHTERKSWEDARQSCRNSQRDLVSINNVHEWEYVVDQIKSSNTAGCSGDFWISGYKTSNGLWLIEEGVPVVSSLWRSGQPDNEGGNENCLELYSHWNYKQSDEECDNKYCYICEV